MSAVAGLADVELDPWDVALDAFDEQVRRQEVAFWRGLPAPLDLVLDPPSGPLSDDQRLRARGLVARSEALADEIVALLAARARTTRSAYGRS
jgi:hypothetical protein